MIFSAINENGTPSWKLVLCGKKTVTRRQKPQPINAIRAVQPGRGKKSIGRIKIKSCELSGKWYNENIIELAYLDSVPFVKSRRQLEEFEARREGFDTWQGLWNWIVAHAKGEPNSGSFYRIEFELIK